MDAKGKLLVHLVSKAKEARKRFDDIRERTEKYDYGDAKTDYKDWDECLSFRAKVYKTQQFKREIGSRLYNNNPVTRVETKDWSPPESQVRAQLISQYLNYIPKENNMAGDIRAVINDALGAGRGVVWYGLHRDKPNIVVGAYDTIENLYCDADARRWEDMNYVIRQRCKPKWWMIGQFPKKKATIAGLASSGRTNNTDDRAQADSSMDMVTYYEVYMRVGLVNYQSSLEYEDMEGMGGRDDRPMMYTVSEDGHIIDEGDWPIPYHIDGMWPCRVLDFYDHPKSVWPISPLEPGLGWQEAINWVATMIVAKFQRSSRMLVALMEANGVKLDEDAIDKVVYGNAPVDVFRLKVNAPHSEYIDVNKYIQQVQQTADLAEAMQVLDHLNREFEMATGLYEFLYHGQQGGIDRSAQASAIRDRNTKTRIDDMQSRIDAFLEGDARQKAMAARYLLDGEDIKPLLGPQAAEAWGVLMPTEQLDKSYWSRQFRDDGFMPDVADQMAMETIAGGVSLEQWMAETDYTIEVGSTQRKSPEARSDALKEAHNQWVPIMIQHGALQAAAALGAEWAKDIGLDQSTIQTIQAFPQEIAQAQAAMQQAAAPPADPNMN